MNITKDTTDDQILASVRLDKIALSKRIESNPELDPEEIAMLANSIGHEEGRAMVRAEYRNALQYGASEDAQRRMLTRILLRDPDDTYSGRLNDFRRAKADGKRREVEEILTRMGVSV